MIALGFLISVRINYRICPVKTINSRFGWFYYGTRRRVIVLTAILMTIFDIMHHISPRMNQVVALPNFPNN
ncbi:hypothetical protein DVH03_02920 [Lactiplantibacillus plantarum]|nr:hypothetical protein DVH03_02920 [Lactiplantibacillus plantarum]